MSGTTEVDYSGKIFINNLPFKVTESEIKNATGTLDVVEIELPKRKVKDRETGELDTISKGFAILTFESKEKADAALEQLSGVVVGERSITAKHYNPVKPAKKTVTKKPKTTSPKAESKEAAAPKVQDSEFGAKPKTHKYSPPKRKTKEEKQAKLEDGIPSKTNVFIGNLDSEVTSKDLRDFLADYEPQWVRVPKRDLAKHVYMKLKKSNVIIYNKGIAFVRFADEATQQKAIKELNGKEFKGKPLNVTIAVDSKIPESSKENEIDA
ncbi:nucleic acid binding protein [[Candida] boidinii]|uniref:Unnamed protein product n=1 Tax=Candida boidinii TaxID=5477 RepID=A0ACB5TJM0_CANBO|nr:nucleic acid binding protein [[Candida] boidinii]OWB60349.1 nucleic acid binding protein [[Candida] boidinii]OWB72621.1 nucleic acid binding protein [[Candida] boidinii]OWB76623.1 nucleic acid binding protein [[Candida] boidinii]GME89987.1 unnamed protein product [[Candida] boidinii]